MNATPADCESFWDSSPITSGQHPVGKSSWANTKAAYRFFSNPRISEEEILGLRILLLLAESGAAQPNAIANVQHCIRDFPLLVPDCKTVKALQGCMLHVLRNGSFSTSGEPIHAGAHKKIRAQFLCSTERIGFPTQKRLRLLDRIVEISSEPDAVVLDAFCGCETALVAAQNASRQWIGIDVSPYRLSSHGEAARIVAVG